VDELKAAAREGIDFIRQYHSADDRFAGKIAAIEAYIAGLEAGSGLTGRFVTAIGGTLDLPPDVIHHLVDDNGQPLTVPPGDLAKDLADPKVITPPADEPEPVLPVEETEAPADESAKTDEPPAHPAKGKSKK
jgi:hypothetical protein